MDLLKYCPFCGGSVVLDVRIKDDNARSPRPHRFYFIECDICEVIIEEMSSTWIDDIDLPPETISDKKTKQFVVGRWNHRYMDVFIEKELDRLRAIEVKWKQLGLDSLFSGFGDDE